MVVRRAARTDANHAAIVKALRAVGASVQSLAGVADGCPDILVGYRGVNLLLELKDSTKPPSGRRLTAEQVKWIEAWRGDVRVVDSVGGALRALGVA
jgi:hypothetical protein